MNNLQAFHPIITNLLGVEEHQKDDFLKVQNRLLDLMPDKVTNRQELVLLFRDLQSFSYHYFSNTSNSFVKYDDELYEILLHKETWFESWVRLWSTVSKLERLSCKYQNFIQAENVNQMSDFIISSLSAHKKKLTDNIEKLNKQRYFHLLTLQKLMIGYLKNSFLYGAIQQINSLNQQENAQDKKRGKLLQALRGTANFQNPHNNRMLMTLQHLIQYPNDAELLYDENITLATKEKENAFVLIRWNETAELLSHNQIQTKNATGN